MQVWLTRNAVLLVLFFPPCQAGPRFLDASRHFYFHPSASSTRPPILIAFLLFHNKAFTRGSLPLLICSLRVFSRFQLYVKKNGSFTRVLST